MLVSKFTLTSKMGSFIFNDPVILSHAKLIRDSITGQFFSPAPNEPKIGTADEAKRYAKHHIEGKISEIPFEVVINPIEC